MSYQVLARKWRPRIFREMVGQEHVLQALINALDHNRLHHAYLFTGTRGVGKTSIARILAKCLNCETGVSSEPCETCSACLEISEGRFVDLIEVDAASRTKVEDTRELLDNVQYAPTRGRYKIYIIDEVHMLSSHSFNALLKTLEEPPEHVKFLLATTDPQKLPVTILSRCLQFNLKNMSPERIVEHLTFVLSKELVPCDEAALWLLARAADGSMRDALSLTDQSISFGNGKVAESDVASMLGTIDQKLIQHIIDALIYSDGARLLAAVSTFADQAPDYNAALSELLALLHRIAIAQALPESVDNGYGDKAQVLDFAQKLAAEDVQLFYQTGIMGRRDLNFASSPRSGFEMTLLRMLAFKPQGVVDIPSQELPSHSVEANNTHADQDSSEGLSAGSVQGGAVASLNGSTDNTASLEVNGNVKKPQANTPSSHSAVSIQNMTPATVQAGLVNTESVEVLVNDKVDTSLGDSPGVEGYKSQEAQFNKHPENHVNPNGEGHGGAGHSGVGHSGVGRDSEGHSDHLDAAVGNQDSLTQKSGVNFNDGHDPSKKAQSLADSLPSNTLPPEGSLSGLPTPSAHTEALSTPSLSAPSSSALTHCAVPTNSPVAAQGSLSGSSDGGASSHSESSDRNLNVRPIEKPQISHLRDQIKAIESSTLAVKKPSDDMLDRETVCAQQASLPERLILAELTPNHWVSLYRQLNVKGILSSTVANSVLLSRESNYLQFVLDETKASLFDTSHAQRLSDLLSDYFKEPVKVNIVLGRTPDNIETPAMFRKRELREQRVKAIELLNVDPIVTMLKTQFGASLDESSIEVDA